MIACTIFLLAMTAAAMPSVPQLVAPGIQQVSSVPLSRKIYPSTGNIAERDRARAAELYKRGKSLATSQHDKRQSSVPATQQVVTYVVQVGVGSPPTNHSLIIDTGSSNTWVGANEPYTETSTSRCPDGIVKVMYGSGLFFGVECEETVTLSPDLVIPNQSIGVAEFSWGFDGVDGILGIGPTNLTKGTVQPSNSPVPTLTDNLFNQGTIPEKVVGIYFAPTTSESDANGEMTFGGIDTSKTTEPVTFAPITSTSPSSEYFGIDQNITYGNENTTVLPFTAGIVDTGTTLTLLATDAFNTYMENTGAIEDKETGLLSISPENYKELQSLYFNIAGTTFEFTKNAQTWPRALNAAIGGSPDDIYLVIGDLGQLGGSGLEFINGMAFLERFYSAFDSTNNRVGIATTAHTFDETN